MSKRKCSSETTGMVDVLTMKARNSIQKLEFLFLKVRKLKVWLVTIYIVKIIGIIVY